jgi:hypothetical protein
MLYYVILAFPNLIINLDVFSSRRRLKSKMSETGKTEFSPDERRRHQSNKHVFTGLPRFGITIVDLQTTNNG